MAAPPLDSTGIRTLAYWADVEALTPSPLNGAAMIGNSPLDWADKTKRSGTARAGSDELHVENTVFFGVFSISQASGDVAARLGRAPDHQPEASRKSKPSYLASCSVGQDGRIRAGSFRPATFALRFEALGERHPRPEDLERRRADLQQGFEAEFAAWLGDAARPLTARDLSSMADWLRRNLRAVPDERKEREEVWRSSRLRRGDEDEEGPVGGGFYLADLHRVAEAVRRGVSSPPLAQYLASAELPERQRRDADNPAAISAILDPRLTPPGKWPGRGRGPHALVLRQQMAVNEALAPDSALVGVNGPPGTGKSTLLRDVIAAVIVARAEAMVGFRDPAAAFRDGVSVDLEKKTATAWRLDPRLRGFGILVCSSNNTAVANITRELPMLDSVAEAHRQNAGTMRNLDFFREVSDAVAGGEGTTWGMVSAALGNAGNRRDFLKAWWPESGAERKVVEAVVLGEPELRLAARSGGKERLEVEARVGGERTLLKSFEPGEHGPALAQARAEGWPILLVVRDDQYRRSGQKSLVVSSVNPKLRGVRERLRFGADDWRAAIERFRASRRRVETLTEAIAALREIAFALPGAIQDVRDAEREAEAAAGRVPGLEGAARAAAQACAEGERDRDALIAEQSLLAARKPWSIARLWSRLLRRPDAWAVEAEELGRRLAAAHRLLGERRDARAAADAALEAAVEVSSTESARVAQLRRTLRGLEDRRAAARARFGAEPMSTEALEEMGHEGAEQSFPWNSPELDWAREGLFVAAIAVHRAFIAAAAERMKDNLDLMALMLSGKERNRIGKAAGPDLWDTFFMAVPVVSSTFASVATMFGDSVGAGDIGWLLVDEAGQALPQAAVGALWRSRRALVVGDPKQIEPVCPVPATVTTLLAAHHGIEDRAFDPKRASAQSLADRRSALVARIGRGNDAIWVGCPLRVHRRCSEPMFSISNRVSYADSMVLGRAPLDTASWRGTRPEYGPGGHPSAWFDMPYEPEGEGHWVASQGRVVLNMLLRMAEQHTAARSLFDGKGKPLAGRFLDDQGMPEAFVITPFRSVRDGMAQLVAVHADDFTRRNPAITRDAVFRWAGMDNHGRKVGDDARIGTVHAFQGKQSPTVFLLLGASPAARRAVEWAGDAPNLLNVAATRAEEAFYVVGGHRLWAGCGPFRSATSADGPVLPVYEVPEFVGTVPDPDRIERIDTLEGHLDVLRRAFEEAKEFVRISSPFLTPNAVAFPGLPIPTLVRRAVSRGVRVVVFNDPALARVADAHERAWNLLANAGAEMVEVSKVHAKTLCVDDKEIVEGSFNWLSAARENGEYLRHECSFRYVGRMAPELVARAVEQMSRRKVAALKKASPPARRPASIG